MQKLNRYWPVLLCLPLALAGCGDKSTGKDKASDVKDFRGGGPMTERTRQLTEQGLRQRDEAMKKMKAAQSGAAPPAAPVATP